MCADGMHGGTLLVKAAEITPGPDAPHAARALLARSREIGEARASATGEPFERLRLELGTAHPLYALAGDPPGEDRRAYALYVRIEDLAGFVELVAPALEARLAASSEAQRSGPLALAVGREGLRLQLERGRLRCVERWQPTTEERGHLAFPGLTFLQLLLGFRSLGELQHAFPDCYVWSEGHVSLVDVLFPAAPSHLVPVS